MGHGSLKKGNGNMGSLQIMNQDGEWEKFPSDEEMMILKNAREGELTPAIHPEITTVCHLCNEPFPMEHIMITGGSMGSGYTWSCPKCHAITSTGKA